MSGVLKFLTESVPNSTATSLSYTETVELRNQKIKELKQLPTTLNETDSIVRHLLKELEDSN